VEDHFGIQRLAHVIRGGPPSTGIATGANPVPSGTGIMAITHRRPGEMPLVVLIGYGATFERPEPSGFICSR
jgi:hypothetical protein